MQPHDSSDIKVLIQALGLPARPCLHSSKCLEPFAATVSCIRAVRRHLGQVSLLSPTRQPGRPWLRQERCVCSLKLRVLRVAGVRASGNVRRSSTAVPPAQTAPACCQHPAALNCFRWLSTNRWESLCEAVSLEPKWARLQAGCLQNGEQRFWSTWPWWWNRPMSRWGKTSDIDSMLSSCSL